MIMERPRILCYGDSNTWGYDPMTDGRHPANVRWTGVLASLLGDAYTVIEEGLNGRTTDLDEPGRTGRNGHDYLIPCLDSHYPLDGAVLALGTNDAKAIFDRTPADIAAGMEKLVRVARGRGLEDPSSHAKIVLLAPPAIHESAADPRAWRGAAAKIAALPALYRAIAADHGLIFVDASTLEPGADGVHLSAESHARLARMVHAHVVRPTGTPI